VETLANLESFVRSAEASSFSVAARRLSLTPAAVSRNVAMLERNLGVRLFQRTTRKLTLTEAGERFLLAMQDHMEGRCRQRLQTLAPTAVSPPACLRSAWG
jgi:DNA-binding transcriptional LysR family regulator